MGTVTISGTAYDVYSDTADAIADAKAYLKAKIGETWAEADRDDQRKALVSATRWVVRTLAGRLADSDDIPDPATTPANEFLAQATYEAAQVLISDATAQDKQNTGSNTKSVKAGSAEVHFFRPTSGTALPSTAQALVIRFIDSLGAATNFGPLATGTDGESEFTDQDRFGRQDPFP